MASLYQAPNASRCRVITIPNAPLLQSLGIFAGAVVTKKTTYALGGPVLLDMQSRDVAIGKGLAVDIQVEIEEGACV